AGRGGPAGREAPRGFAVARDLVEMVAAVLVIDAGEPALGERRGDRDRAGAGQDVQRRGRALDGRRAVGAGQPAHRARAGGSDHYVLHHAADAGGFRIDAERGSVLREGAGLGGGVVEVRIVVLDVGGGGRDVGPGQLAAEGDRGLGEVV